MILLIIKTSRSYLHLLLTSKEGEERRKQEFTRRQNCGLKALDGLKLTSA